jgi:predicted NBD/HSP70 family sugar kinase
VVTKRVLREKTDAAAMRARNSNLLLDMIWREQRISRAEIARRAGLSPSTVSAIVRDLEQMGLVQDIGTGSSTGGRRPILLGFCDDAFAIIGVELGATHIAVALTDLRGRVKVFREQSHAVRTDPQGTLEATQVLIDDSLAASGVALPRVLGIGVAIPSPLDPDEPGRMSPFIVPAWAGYDIRAWLHERYQHPIVIDNDANLGALAEQWWGEHADDLTYIKIGMGVGAGHIIRGELYRGAGGSAGEVGHIVLDPAGPECMCGNRGCLATYIGSNVLLARAQARMRPASEPLSMGMIVEQARQGHAAAQEIIATAGHYLGIALAGLVNILNPAVVVLGGALASAGDMLIDPLRTSIRSHALSKSIAETRIVASALDRRAIAVGAATLVLAAALRDYTLFPLAADAPSQ